MPDFIPPYFLNNFGQPIGVPMPAWMPRQRPARITLQGRYSRVEPLDVASHAADLYDAYSADDGRMWTYLSIGPFTNLESYTSWATQMSQSTDPLFNAIVDSHSGRAIGVASYLRIDPANGVIEVGHLAFSPQLQRTRAATDAMVLMMQYAFELGYRRYEWKCDALNTPSRAAAQRLGFSYEGTFRQAIVYKERSRDTAWYSIIDTEWPVLRAMFTEWLDPANFDGAGKQRMGLSTLTATIRPRAAAGPNTDL